MGKISDFFKKCGFTIALCFIAVGLLFSAACCVYTAIVNYVVGTIGILGTIVALGYVAYKIYKNIKNDGVV